MRRKIFYSAMIAAALTMVWGCSSSKDDPDEPEKVSTWTKVNGSVDNWQINLSGNDSAPTWTAPDVRQYESWMILMVTLQPELAKYSTEKDLMAVTINDQVRALASPAIAIGETHKVTFILKILGNETSEGQVSMTLRYYNDQLRQTFTLRGNQFFVPEVVYGVDETFMPDFMEGCPTYPVMMPATIKLSQAAQEELQPELGDLLAVFVGDECRGLTTIDEHLFAVPYTMHVFGRQEGEKGILYYYNAREKTVWNTQQSVTITPTEQTFEVGF